MTNDKVRGRHFLRDPGAKGSAVVMAERQNLEVIRPWGSYAQEGRPQFPRVRSDAATL
jgi:hypothetical protein